MTKRTNDLAEGLAAYLLELLETQASPRERVDRMVQFSVRRDLLRLVPGSEYESAHYIHSEGVRRFLEALEEEGLTREMASELLVRRLNPETYVARVVSEIENRARISGETKEDSRHKEELEALSDLAFKRSYGEDDDDSFMSGSGSLPLYFRFEYRFHPVGQGLFSSGSLGASRAQAPAFRWVYDCGTSSSTKFIARELGRLDPPHSMTAILDLVVISHFDTDHVSGLCELLRRYRVRVLMLPYVHLADRLLVAIAGGLSPRDERLEFFVDPVAFIRRQRDSEGAPAVERILFVLPNDEGPDVVEEGGFEGLSSELPTRLSISVEEEDPLEARMDFVKREGSKVEFLKRGGALRLPGFWEFVPYNDQEVTPQSTDFRKLAHESGVRLLAATDMKSRERALAELKELYDKTFGRTSRMRNDISLFLYAGPLLGPRATAHLRELATFEEHRANRVFKWFSGLPRWDERRRISEFWFGPVVLDPYPGSELYGRWASNSRRCWNDRKMSLLYTGDGSLDRPERLNRLVNFMRPTRIDRTAVFQVMHHGSRKNYFRGIARSLDLLYSVFSSNPKDRRYGHPHKEVVQEFRRAGPVQVDTRRGVSFDGFVLPRR